MTWENHIYGDESNSGLITKLEQRAAMIWKLSFIMPIGRLKQIAQGIFFSLLDYCIELYGNTWCLGSIDINERHSSAFRREDNRRLQVIVNKVLRIILQADRDTPTSTLCKATGQLSVHQRVAFATLCSIFKTISSGKPKFSYDALHYHPASPPRWPRRGNAYNCKRVDYRLSISRDSFMFRGSRLFNMIPSEVARAPSFKVFKREVRKWVSVNVPVQP